MLPSARYQRVLLTGASGTVGTLAGRALLAAGVPLRVLVHRRRPAWIAPGSDVETRTGDVLLSSSLRGVADGCDAVVHAAGRTGFGALDRERQRRVNVEGTEAVLREAESAGVRRFVLVGYTGTIQERGGDAAVDESTPPVMQYESEYVRMKLEAEALTLEANRPESFRTMVVSPGVLLGAGGDSLLGSLALLFLRQELPFRLLEDVWVAVTAESDVGPALLAALERGAGGRRYFAIGDSMRLAAFYRMLGARSGVPAPRRRLPDLLVEELGLLAPLLPPHSFLRRLVLPRELALHLRRLAPARNDRTRAELGFAPRPMEDLLDEVVREGTARPE